MHAPLLKNQESDGFTPSVYGVWLATNWTDATFNFGVTGRWGFKLYDLLRHKRDTGFVFIDVGANFGTYSLIASGNERCVGAVAIEPNPAVFAQLERNAAFNGARKVEAINCGIAQENGTMLLSVNQGHLGAATFRDKGGTRVEVSVRNHTLFNEIHAKHKDLPVFVKIDVEGFEPEVVGELVTSELRHSVQEVFVEVSPKWLSQEDIHSMLAQLTSIGLEECWRSLGIDQYDVYYKKRGTSI